MKLSNQGRVPAFTALSAGTFVFLMAGFAAAQTAPPPAEPEAPAPTSPEVAPETGVAPPEAQPEAPAVEGSVGMDMGTDVAPEPLDDVPPAEPTMAPAEPAPTAAELAIEEAAPSEAVTAGTPSLFVFADAWAGFQTAKSGIEGGGGGVYANNGPDGTAESGFGLNWLGADLGYDAGEWGLNGSLRFGDGVAIYGTGTLGPITNAYASWRPAEGLDLSIGTFGTIYGAEVAESWLNLNYTRGELYFNMQPFWHTGLRAEYTSGDFVVRGLLVNDANTSNLGSGAMNAGAQAGYSSDSFGLIAGVLQSLAPETTVANGGFIDTFVDVVLTVNAGDFSLIGNFDLNVGSEAAGFWGASLAAGYGFTPQFGMAVRGEYLASSDGFLFGTDEDESLITGTLTFDVKPVEGVQNFVVRWDNRIEAASDDVYSNLDGDGVEDVWFSSTVGVVAYADLL